jgi:CBS domain-containing protein
MTTCKELMTHAVVTCLKSDSVADVVHMMEAADVGSIPVVQSTNWKCLVGIITDRDIATRIVGRRLPPNTKVGDVMTLLIVTCRPDDDIAAAMAKMRKYQVRRIPIVEDNNTIVGIIAQADIARYMDAQSTGEMVSGISEDTLVEV